MNSLADTKNGQSSIGNNYQAAHSFAQLKEAIGMLRESEKVALQEAGIRCPDLLQLESNPLVYLYCCSKNNSNNSNIKQQRQNNNNNNGSNHFQLASSSEPEVVWTAARRLATYWNQRVQSLAIDAAFQSLLKNAQPQQQQSPDLFFQLPGVDCSGRRIFYYRIFQEGRNNNNPLSNRQQIYPPQVDIKQAFNVLSTRTTNFTAFDIVLIIHVVGRPSSSTSPLIVSMDVRLQNLLSSAMPWGMHAIHIACHIPNNATTMTNAAPLLDLQLLPSLQQLATVHLASTQIELSQRLIACGIPFETIAHTELCSNSRQLSPYNTGFPVDRNQCLPPQVTPFDAAIRNNIASFQQQQQQLMMQQQMMYSGTNTDMKTAPTSAGNISPAIKKQKTNVNGNGTTRSVGRPDLNFFQQMQQQQQSPSSMGSVLTAAAAQPTEGSESSTKSITNNPQREKDLKELAFAVSNLPDASKAAYLEAQKRAPDLIKKESNPGYFLDREDQDVWAAASRLTTYWERRKELFGPDRAFLSLARLPSSSSNDNGGGGSSIATSRSGGDTIGALTNSDLEIMATGVLVPLPYHSSSSSSNTTANSHDVFCFDRSRFSGNSEHLQMSLLRSLFYWSNMTMQKEISRCSGIVAIAMVKHLQQPLMGERLDAKKAMQLIEEALPIKIRAIHICVLGSSDDILTNLKRTVVPAIMMRLKSFRSVGKCHLHGDKIPTSQVAKGGDLAGIQLPRDLEGLFQYNDFEKCFEQLKHNRRVSFSNPLGIDAKESNNALNSNTRPTKRALYESSSYAAALESPGFGKSDLSVSHRSDLSVSWGSAESSHFPKEAPGASKRGTLQPNAGAKMDEVIQNRNPSPLLSDTQTFVETSAVQHEGIRRLEDAMDVLSQEQTAAYKSAIKKVPYLVQTESDPLKFLRFEKYDAWAAALRLANYWKWRVKVFGSRAFLPLTLSGNGALSKEDIASFKAGYFSFLPNDPFGRTVIFYDPSKRNTNAPGERHRVGFYFWSVVCENEVCITKGWTGLIILGKSNFNTSTLDNTNSGCIDMVLESFPTFCYKMHIANSPSGLGQRLFFEVVVPMVFRFLEKILRDRTVVHVGTTEQLIEKLGIFGFASGDLPDSLGGPWTAAEHLAWMSQRARLENSRYNSFSLAAQKKPPAVDKTSKSLESPQLVKDSKEIVVKEVISANATFGEERMTETPETLKAGLKQLWSAIDTIPEKSKAALSNAMQKAPNLVKNEPDPAAFLRYERFDPMAAAQRLAKYWEVRAEIFESRAFLPLDQTGEGALDRRDLSVIGTSYLMFLGKDSHGRAVLMCDGTRLSKSTRLSRLRTSFYMYSIAAETELSQTAGMVLLYVMTEPSFDRANKECLDVVMSAIPACIRDVHLLRYPIDASEQGFSIKMDPAMLHQFRQLAKNQVVSHVTGTRVSIAKKLQPYGLDLDQLPKSIGGNFGYDRFFQWQELRSRLEWNLPAGVSNKETASMFDFVVVTPSSKLSEDDKVERKRRLNIIHSRRKRERERIEIEVLHEQCDEHRERKKDLQKQHETLKGLFSQASALVESHSKSVAL